VAVTDVNTLLTWERAEIKRSSTEASKAAAVRPTSANLLKRYTSTEANTPYPLEYAFHLVGDARGLRVLDLGSGTGSNSTLLAARGGRVTSMDISPDLLALAERRVELDGFGDSITTVCGSAHSIPLPSNSLDLVFGAAILHHLDLALTAQEVYRVLKPGGRAIFMEPTRNSRLLAFLRRLIPYQAADVSPFERPLRADEIASFASLFTRTNTRRFRLPFVPLLRLILPTRFERRIYEWDRALLKRWPRLGYFATVTVFEVEKRRP
jgi:ubiquinone/menaquinone biosynthesis C-methylase UbiE